MKARGVITIFLGLMLCIPGCQEKQPQNATQKEEEPLFTATPSNTSPSGYFVPKDLDDCYLELDRGLSPVMKAILKKGTDRLTPKENDLLMNYHFLLGMWIRNNWDLWKGGELSRYFHKMGLEHPDDMSAVILDSYAARLRNEPYDIDRIVRKCQLYYKRVVAPKDYADPVTGAKITPVGDKKQYILEDAVIHIGVNVKTGETWFYEYEKGWYRPTEEDQKRLEVSHGTVTQIN